MSLRSSSCGFWTVCVGMLAGALTSAGVAQDPGADSAPKAGSSAEDRDTDEARLRVIEQAWGTFKAKEGDDWQVRWDSKTRLPRMVYGGTSSPYPGQPVRAAEAFLAAHKTLFAMEDAFAGSRVLSSSAVPVSSHRVEFQLQHRGLDVYHATIIVILDRAGRVMSVTSTAWPIVDLDIQPALTVQEISDRLATIANDPPVNVTAPPRLAVYPEGKGRLAYLVYVTAGPDSLPFEYVLDANTAAVIRSTKLVKDLDGKHESNSDSRTGGASAESSAKDVSGAGDEETGQDPSSGSEAGEPSEDDHSRGVGIDPCLRQWQLNGPGGDTTVTQNGVPLDPFEVRIRTGLSSVNDPEGALQTPAVYSAGVKLLPCLEYTVSFTPTLRTWDSYTNVNAFGDVFFVNANSTGFYWNAMGPFPLGTVSCSTLLVQNLAYPPGTTWMFGGDVRGDGFLCQGAAADMIMVQETDSTKNPYLSIGLDTGLTGTGDSLYPSWGDFDVVITSPTYIFNPSPIGLGYAAADMANADAGAPCDAYEAVVLSHFVGQPEADDFYHLNGTYVDTQEDIENPMLSRPKWRDDTFPFTRSCPEFEAVMCYYHLSESMTYIEGLGYAPNNKPIRVDPHGLTGADNSHYVGAPAGMGYLAFGEGGVDDAEDADIILHEYGHALHDDQRPGVYFGAGNNGFGDETGSMGEGFGDYWACSAFAALATDPAAMGEWDAQNALGLRRVDGVEHYPEDMNNEVHDDGEIWSAALWEIFNAHGKAVADNLVLTSHTLVPNDPTFADGAVAILMADQNLYAGAQRESIIQIFLNRGVFRRLDVSANVPAVNITVMPQDVRGDANGVTDFSRVYPYADLVNMDMVTLEAPNTLPNGSMFMHWALEGVNQPGGQRVIMLTMDNTPPGHTARAIYSGICCLPNGMCVETDSDDCANQGGTFADGGGCAANMGSCCRPDGSCVETTQECCTGFGGTFHAGEDCTTDLGSCCGGDGSCTVTTPECCTDMGGTFNAGADCSTTGACTIDDDCIDATEECCDAAGGSFDSGADCDSSGCAIFGNRSIAEQVAEAVGDVHARVFVAAANESGAGAGATASRGSPIQAFIDGSLVLNVIGTAGADQIALRVNVDDPNTLDVEDLALSIVVGGFNLSSFVSISIDAGADTDLVVFDDANGSVAALKPYTINAGDGDDALLGGTGSLAVQDVIDLMNLLLSAQNIITSAEAIVDLAGANDPVGGGTNDLFTNAVNLLLSANDDLITPAGNYIFDTNDQLISPASQFVADAHDILIVGAQNLAGTANSDLVLEALDMKADAEQKGNLAQAYLDEAQNGLLATAQQNINPACDDLVGTGTDDFIAQLETLVAQLVALADQCPPEPAEPPEAPDNCVVLEELVDCMEREIENFIVLGEICEDAADLEMVSAAEDFLADIESGLWNAGDDFEARADALAAMADLFVLTADAFVNDAEAFNTQIESTLTGAGDAFDARAQTELIQAGDDFAAQADADLVSVRDALIAQADQLIIDAQTIMAQTVDILEAATPRGSGRAGPPDCSNIQTQNTIIGGPGPNLLLGSFQNDLIKGLGGLDLIVGLAGDDKLQGGDGLDLIFGGSGVNELRGGKGIDLLVGGSNKDCMFGDDGLDVMIGLGGDDEMQGGNYIDVMLGFDGDDIMRGGEGIDLMFGFAGEDEMYGDNCIDLLIGGPDDDTMYGGMGQVLSIGNFSIDLGDVMFGMDGADTMHGDDAADVDAGIDVMFGGNGDDHIFGAHGGDLIIGTFELKLGNVIFGGAGNDEIRGKDGIDVMFGGDDNDTMYAGIGDELTFSSGNFSLNLGDLMFGGDGIDTMHGDEPASTDGGIDVMFGGNGNDMMFGYDGGDLVIGSNFTLKIGNVMFGNDNDDTMSAKAGIDFMFGGSGNDTMSAGEGYNLTLDGGNFMLNIGDFMFGMTGDDTMHGDQASPPTGGADDGIDFMFGGDDGDRMYGGKGSQVVIGGLTGVVLQFGNVMFGSQGDDIMSGDYQVSPTDPMTIDLMFGGADDDTMDGSNGGIVAIGGLSGVIFQFGNLMFGNPGDDIMDAEDGVDLMFGGPGIDTMRARNGIDIMFGNADDDTMEGGDGGQIVVFISGIPVPIFLGNIMFGNSGADTMDSDGRSVPILDIDLMFGNDCRDTMNGGDGILDLMFGNKDRDTMYGEAGFDFMFGNSGDDEMHGGDDLIFIDLMFGNTGDDTMYGEDGPDIMFGNKDNDHIFGGGGLFDLMFGNKGNDEVHGGPGPNIIFGNSGGDDLHGEGFLNLMFGNAEDDWMHGDDDSVSLDLMFGNTGNDRMYGDDGLDLMFGNRGDDELHGGAGLDLLFGNDDNDKLFGDGGTDLMFGNSERDCVFGGAGKDLMFGNSDNDGVWGDSDSDLIFGNSGDDWVYGGTERDLLFGNSGNDILRGDSGGDLMFGNSNNDDMDGGGDGDIMFGNANIDRMAGGSGADIIFGNRDDDNPLVGGGDGSTDRIFGNRGNDTLYGCSEGDRLRGGAGSDTKYPNDCPGLSLSDPPCGEIHGTKWIDRNGDGSADGPLAGYTIYLDPGGRSTVTMQDDPNTHDDETGQYWFTGLTPGTYTVREALPDGFQRIFPGGSGAHTVGLSAGQIVTGIDFINLDLCRPTDDGSACQPGGCSEPGRECTPTVVIAGSTCDNDGEPCADDNDCACGGVCVPYSRVMECECTGGLECVLAGDKDNFESSAGIADVIVIRPEFANWLSRPGGTNATFHGGQPLPFDIAAQAIDWHFGYSFLGLPAMGSAQLTVHFKAGSTIPSTDGFALQFSDAPPAFAWGYSMNGLDGLFGGNGSWTANEELTATFDLAALPVSGGGPPLDLLPRLNADGFLDVYLQDDTGIDYIELCYTPAPASCCDQRSWVDVSGAVGPSPRYDHAMAYDSARGVTVLFGGFDTARRGDTWEWNGAGWSLVAMTGPSARERHAMAYDSNRGRTVLFGGRDNTRTLGDIWEWDGAVWMQIPAAAGPSARRGHKMAYDAARGRVVMFGGRAANSALLGDTWEWDGANWVQSPGAGPAARETHAMAYDQTRGRTVLFGGFTGSSHSNETWEWDGAAWTLIATGMPIQRSYHAMAADDQCGQVLMFGGSGMGPTGTDTWSWDGATWSLLTSASPSFRGGLAMAYDSVRQRVVLFGGYGDTSLDLLGDTWEFGCGPAPRALRGPEFSGGSGSFEPPTGSFESPTGSFESPTGSFESPSSWFESLTRTPPAAKITAIRDTATAGPVAVAAGSRNVPPAAELRPPLVPPPPHDAQKNRYISFVPNNGANVVAFEIILPPCRRAWIGEPIRVDFEGEDPAFCSYVVDEPVFRVWSEDVVHVRGCVIAPANTYEIRAANGAGAYSAPLSLSTVPVWGDVVGFFNGVEWTPPDGVVDAQDVGAVIKKSQHDPTAPHTTWADLAPQWPDYFVDKFDIEADASAMQGSPYPPMSWSIATTAECPLGGVPPVCPAVPGDLDADADVDAVDFGVLLAAFGRRAGDQDFSPCADVDGDHVVTQYDYQHWLQSYRSFVGDPAASPPRYPLGDFDADGDVDLIDVRHYQRCTPAPAEFELPCLMKFDFDDNGEVNLVDWGGFEAVFTGP